MNVNGLWSRVEQTKVFLHLANAADCRLQHSFDENSLLRVYDLVVALLELAINVDVLDVEAGEVLENFIVGPRLNVLQGDNGYNFVFKLRISCAIILTATPCSFFSAGTCSTLTCSCKSFIASLSIKS